jgi:hypothetical protein
MAVSAVIGIVVVALVVVACWYVLRHQPSAADRRSAREESRMRAETDMMNAQRRTGMFGGG